MIEILLQAERAMTMGMLDQAERMYRQAAAADPRNSIAVVGLARVALERGDEPGSWRFARQALEIDPENVAAQRLAERLEEVWTYRGRSIAEVAAAEVDAEAEVAAEAEDAAAAEDAPPITVGGTDTAEDATADDTRVTAAPAVTAASPDAPGVTVAPPVAVAAGVTVAPPVAVAAGVAAPPPPGPVPPAVGPAAAHPATPGVLDRLLRRNRP